MRSRNGFGNRGGSGAGLRCPAEADDLRKSVMMPPPRCEQAIERATRDRIVCQTTPSPLYRRLRPVASNPSRADGSLRPAENERAAALWPVCELAALCIRNTRAQPDAKDAARLARQTTRPRGNACRNLSVRPSRIGFGICLTFLRSAAERTRTFFSAITITDQTRRQQAHGSTS